MTTIITTAEKSANHRRHVGTEAVAAAAPGNGLVDTVRSAVRELVSFGKDDARELALSLVEKHWQHLDSACPLTEDLRPWQLLASDLAVALEDSDDVRARRAEALAEDIRSTVTMMARNPVGELALRPASRRLLVALHDLGGSAEISRVRDVSRHSATHFSNILKALRGHGLVDIETVADDRRRKTLSLTRRGEAEIARHVLSTQPDASFTSNIRINRSVSTEHSYPQALHALHGAD